MLLHTSIAGTSLAYLRLDNVLRIIHLYIARMTSGNFIWALLKFFSTYVSFQQCLKIILKRQCHFELSQTTESSL